MNPPPLNLHLTHSWLGFLALAIFAIAYTLVMLEEVTHLRKSKPTLLAASFLWLLAAIAAKSQGLGLEANAAIKHNILDYAELFFFLVVAMTYVNAMEERQVFSALRSFLTRHHLNYRQLFWITGFCAFALSPIADNMTTALILGAVIVAVGRKEPRFITLGCINTVVAANAGGAFSPFGDITTLMVWQKNALHFTDFFHIFIPSLVNFLIPASLMHWAIPKGIPSSHPIPISIAKGGLAIIAFFLLTIFITVSLEHFFHLPPVTGMMMGLGFLQCFGYWLKKTHDGRSEDSYDVFHALRRIEWDTLLFFYGVMLCIGALSALGYLDLLSHTLYNEWGKGLSAPYQQAPANVMIGVLSSLVDNIPLMFAVLTMDPPMNEGQWLLITLTAGVGGSLLSIGSAAGVALMGQARGHYTFLSHLKWSWAIGLGYIGAILTHFLINRAFFT